MAAEQREIVLPVHVKPSPRPVLPPDVWSIVIDYLYQTSPSSLKRVRLVNTHLSELVRYAQHRVVQLSISSELTDRSCQKLDYIHKYSLWQAVRHICFLSPPAVNQQELQNDKHQHRSIDSLFKSIDKMTGLKTVSCHSAVPERLVREIALRSGIDFEVRIAGQSIPDCKRMLVDLISLSNLRSLQIVRAYTTADECTKLTGPLKQVLLTCPRLQRLHLDIHLPRVSSRVYEPPSEYCGIDLRESERPPPLREFCLKDYPRTAEHSDWYSEISTWAESWDWSSLVRFDGPFFLAHLLAKKCTAMKQLDLTADDPLSPPVSLSLLQDIPSSLTHIGLNFVVLSRSQRRELVGSAIRTHGQTLTSLRFHQIEDVAGLWRLHVREMNLQLRQIAHDCPKIEHLALDMVRSMELQQDSETWSFEWLDIIGEEFPRLSHLEIWFELGITPSITAPVKPYVTFDAVSVMFQRLRDTQSSRRLKSLIVHTGAVPSMGHDYLMRDAYWASQNTTTFECTLSERDDEASAGIFSTRCVDLDQVNNARLADGQNAPIVPVPPPGRAGNFYKGYNTERVQNLYSLAKYGPKPYKG